MARLQGCVLFHVHVCSGLLSLDHLPLLDPDQAGGGFCSERCLFPVVIQALSVLQAAYVPWAPRVFAGVL